jgi:serine phosphatase RsbU (regulator of sigma subunit)
MATMRLERLDGITLWLLAFGVVAFVLAGLSVGNMFLPRPYDGVVLESDDLGKLEVRQVVPGSGADAAGIRPGDRIVGIDREVLRSPAHAAQRLQRYDIGAEVPYLVDRIGDRRTEMEVVLGRRQIGDPTYLYVSLLGASFFLVGLFVLLRQPLLRVSRIFYLLCSLFMLFLICRLRPASYTWIDTVVLGTGTGALLFLPASFLHFFLLFPQPAWKDPPRGAWPALLTFLYGLPPLVLVAAYLLDRGDEGLDLISGAPVANWWLLAVYMLAGLVALAVTAVHLPTHRERRGAALVFAGSLFGVVPFLVLAVAFPALLHTGRFLFYGIVPLALVPITFAYAIVRYELLDIRVILKKSLLYTLTTAAITGAYALGIASMSTLFKNTRIASSPWFLILFALSIVLLFEPLRHRLQGPVDRFFYAERSRLQEALMALSEELSARDDPATVVRDLVERLPGLLGLAFAGLYQLRDGRFERMAGPATLPESLPDPPGLDERLQRRQERRNLAAVDELSSLAFRSSDGARFLHGLTEAGVEVVGELVSPRRRLGLVVLSGKTGQMAHEAEELTLLAGLLHQAAIALETSLLLEERTQQAELERELEIAASIQDRLLPRTVRFAPGWSVAAVCRPARHVGGDFIAELPTGVDHHRALAYGDVSGKSVSGALVMMAAYEALSSLALTATDPEELMRLANQRLYSLGKKSFVALGYLAPTADGDGVQYMLAGQPQPLLKTPEGVSEIPLPAHRLPLGGLLNGHYRRLTLAVPPGGTVLGYSDGVVEARSPSGEFFGSERLLTVVENAPTDPDSLVRHVLSAVRDFTRDTDPYDDLTLVAVGRRAETT